MGSFHRPLRVVLLGATGSGKTALVQQLLFGNHVVSNKKARAQLASESDVFEMCVMADRSCNCLERLQVFDTPGRMFVHKATKSNNLEVQDHFVSIADAVILVFSITSQASFTHVDYLHQFIALRSKDVPMVLVGMKADLTQERAVEKETPFVWARARGSEYFECTTLDRTSLANPFLYITTRISSTPGSDKNRLLSSSSLSLATPPSPPSPNKSVGRSSRDGSSLDLANSLLGCLGSSTKD